MLMKEEDVTPANCYAVRRMPLCHSDELQWDPRDFPRKSASMPHSARDIFFAILGGLLILVIVAVNL